VPPIPAPEPKPSGLTPPPDVAPVSPTIGATPTAPPPAPPEPPVSCPWTLRMEIVKGRTQVEARIGDEVQFRVNCVQIVLQAPRGSLEAQGDVKVTGSDLDGTCEHLTINWQDDHVFLEGKAHLKCLRNGQDVELNSDRLSLKLSASSSVKGTGTTKARSSTSSRKAVPAETEDDDLK
jgi:hypothetical protein